jgi:hypothetical protein
LPVRLHQGPLQRAGQEFDENAQRVSWDELLNLNSRSGGGYADLPWAVYAVSHSAPPLILLNY